VTCVNISSFVGSYRLQVSLHFGTACLVLGREVLAYYLFVRGIVSLLTESSRMLEALKSR
jgi:hypothetical protein